MCCFYVTLTSNFRFLAAGTVCNDGGLVAHFCYKPSSTLVAETLNSYLLSNLSLGQGSAAAPGLGST